MNRKDDVVETGKLTIKIFCVALLFAGRVLSQTSAVTVKVEGINEIRPIQVAGVKRDREVGFVVTNESKGDVAIFGRQIGDYFDPTGLAWRADSETGEVHYFDSDKKPILKRGPLEYVDKKVLKPGENLTFTTIVPTSTYMCKNVFWQIVRIRIGNSKKISDILSDPYPSCRSIQ